MNKPGRKIICFLLIAGLLSIINQPMTAHAADTWIMAGVLCQEGQELTHEGSQLYVNKADMKVVNRGTFTTGGFSPYCTSESYVSTFTNEGTMNFDGTNDEYATFHVQNFMNSGKLVIDSCYSFMIDDVGVKSPTIVP